MTKKKKDEVETVQTVVEVIQPTVETVSAEDVVAMTPAQITKEEVNTQQMEEVAFDKTRHWAMPVVKAARDALDAITGLAKAAAEEKLKEMVASKTISEFRMIKVGQFTTQDYVQGRATVMMGADGNVLSVDVET